MLTIYCKVQGYIYKIYRKIEENERLKEERRKNMFRRVNKLDQTVSDEGNFESGVDVTGKDSVIIVGSDDSEINALYTIQPIKYNDKYVYKNYNGNYLYYVKYSDTRSGRWQIGNKNEGIKNNQPIAFINADNDEPINIATWQAWLIFDKESNEWIRQTKVNTYKSSCKVIVNNAWTNDINGDYIITPITFQNRPVFERIINEDTNDKIIIYYEENISPFPRWYVSRMNANLGDINDVIALIQSSALTVDGHSDFEYWQEIHPQRRQWEQNDRFKITGDCAKIKEHDWKKRRQQRQNARKEKQMREAQKQKHCPNDMTVTTEENRDYAIVHWQLYNSDEDMEYSVVYEDDSIAPGSKFQLGRTSVIYSIKDDTGNEVAKCDFIITVVDQEAPKIQCPGDIYIMTQYNTNTGIARWNEPYYIDNTDPDAVINQVSGPDIGSRLDLGDYLVKYIAKDRSGNEAVCEFLLKVVDRQSPKIFGCPESKTIDVFSKHQWAAHPTWDIPKATDAVDGDVSVQLIAGIIDCIFLIHIFLFLYLNIKNISQVLIQEQE